MIDYLDRLPLTHPELLEFGAAAAIFAAMFGAIVFLADRVTPDDPEAIEHRYAVGPGYVVTDRPLSDAELAELRRKWAA